MLKQLLYNEFIKGRTKFDYIFLAIGLLLQVIVFYISKDTLLSFISGLSGIFAVVLCSQRKISQFIFSFLQLFTFIILAYQQRLYGKLLENTFYFITMIIAIINWCKNMDITMQEVKTKNMSIHLLLILFIITIICTIIFYKIMLLTNNTQPLLDSITTVPAIIAQILLMTRYSEQWLFWLFVDICCVFLWFVIGNYCMVVQYIFWSVNCIYGFYNWRKEISND